MSKYYSFYIGIYIIFILCILFTSCERIEDSGPVNAKEVKLVPNIKSAITRVKVTETKNLRNRIVKSKVKTAVKKFETEATAAQYSLTTSAIDKAVAKGVMHKNTAARRKSRYTRLLNGIA